MRADKIAAAEESDGPSDETMDGSGATDIVAGLFAVVTATFGSFCAPRTTHFANSSFVSGRIVYSISRANRIENNGM